MNNSFDKISLIVPVFNEENSIEELVGRTHEALSKAKIIYEIIFVDDHSTDQTRSVISNLSIIYPIILVDKRGKKGKAYSIYEGMKYAQYDVLGMIDADLQYPPEAIPEMILKLSESDVVVSNRKKYKDSKARKLLSKTFRYVFGKALFGLNHDIQSGLKVFKKEVFDTVKFIPNSAWTFDLEFLHRSREAGFKITDHDIVFSKRLSGESKVGFVGQTMEIGFNALRVKTKRIHPAHIPPTSDKSMKGAGIGYKKKKYITHTTIPHNLSALKTFTRTHKLIIGLTLMLAGFGFYVNPLFTLKVVVGVLSAIYFADVFFNLYLIIRSLDTPREITSTDEEIENLDESSLPMYSILCPLYKEARIIPQFLEAIGKISWPKEKLDVILLLEEDDKATIEVAEGMNLPSYVRILVVPHSFPKTKPKACNYGLAHAKGEYLVIYDAEDIPEPMQLKKAYLGFIKADENVICLQAKLNYYNPHQNLLTRFFTAEYSLWFDVTLPGLQSFNTALPLGGTSNHFKTKNLAEVQGWDPFNVTEDADLGVRLFKKGYKTAMIDSITLEEANSKVGNWFRQRSRWIKGYMQTYLVHTRGHRPDVRRVHHSLIFQLVIGGKIAFVLINPFLWIATFSYFALYAYVGPAIEAVYPSAVFYMAITSLVLGNFLFLYYYMIGVAKKNQWNLVKFVFLIPLYWLMISVSAVIALYQLIFKPHYWEKTVHGLHLKNSQKAIVADVVVEVEREQGIIFPKFFKQKLKFILSKRYIAGGAFILAMGIGSFFNFLYNAYLGRVLSLSDFALISLIGGLYSFVSLVAGSFGTTVAFKSGYLIGKKNEQSAFNFWKKTRRKLLIISAFIGLTWIALAPFLTSFFKEQNLYPFILFAPILFIILAYATDRGFISSKLGFGLLAVLAIFEPVLKLIASVLFVEFDLGSFAYAAIPFSVFSAFILASIFARIGKRAPDQNTHKNDQKFPKRFLFVAFLSGISTVILLNVDVVLAKHFLSATDAGLYALVSLIGKMIFFLGSIASPFIIPLVSRNEGGSKESTKVLNLTLIGVSLLIVPGVIALGLFGDVVAPVLFGKKILPALPYLLPISLGMLCFALARVFTDYYLAKKHYTFALVLLVLGLMQAFLIFSFHKDIYSIVYITSGVWALSLPVIFVLHLFSGRIKIFESNIADFLGLFAVTKKAENLEEGKLRILVLNWRDVRHKWAGGAESYVHELSKRWITEGHRVTIFSGNDNHSLRNEVIDGINIVRRGGFYTVYLWAFLYYVLKFRGKFDVIIDSENGIPFFAPLYSKKPVLLLIHHIHQEVFRQQLRFPLSFIARFLEANVMTWVYRKNKVITVSESSKNDIIKIGLGKKSDVSIVYPGIETSLFKKEQKAVNPLFSYVGRLKPYKNIDIAIRAFAQVLKPYPNASLLIIGFGESLSDLQKLAKELDIEKSVLFTGRVGNSEKAKLLAKSWVVLQPSMVEGWGITVIESNASGTPVIASNVNGLKDSVVHGQTGTLVPVGDVDMFAAAMIDFIINEKYRKDISRNALIWSQNFSWDKSSKQFLYMVEDALKQSSAKANRFQQALNRAVSIFL